MQQYMKRNENNETLLHENQSTHLINQLDVKKLLKTAFELPLDIKEANVRTLTFFLIEKYSFRIENKNTVSELT